MRRCEREHLSFDREHGDARFEWDALEHFGPRSGRVDDGIGRGESLGRPDSADASRIGFERRRPAGRLDAHIARTACRQERATETAIVDVTFARRQQGAADVRRERGLGADRFASLEPLCSDPACRERNGVGAQARDGVIAECGADDPVEPQVRIDAADVLEFGDVTRVEPERARAERLERRIRKALGVRREHPSAGPRRGAARLRDIEDAHVGAALREFVGDPKPNEARAQDDDQPAISVCASSLPMQQTSSALPSGS